MYIIDFFLNGLRTLLLYFNRFKTRFIITLNDDWLQPSADIPLLLVIIINIVY